MSAPFNDIRHGDADRLEELLDTYPMTEQELRAALQNVVGIVQALQHKVANLERNDEIRDL